MFRSRSPGPASLGGCSALARHTIRWQCGGGNPLSPVVDAAVKASPVESRWWVPPDCCRQQSVAVGRIPALFLRDAKWSLNARQEAFVKKLAEGASQRAAYLAAGYAARGDNVAEAAASRLFKNVKVQLGLAELRANTAKRHAELQAKIAVRHEITVDTIIAQLEEARQAALTCNPRQTGAAVAATMGLAKLLGLIVDRSEAHVVHHKPAPLPTDARRAAAKRSGSAIRSEPREAADRAPGRRRRRRSGRFLHMAGRLQYRRRGSRSVNRKRLALFRPDSTPRPLILHLAHTRPPRDRPVKAILAQGEQPWKRPCHRSEHARREHVVTRINQPCTL